LLKKINTMNKSEHNQDRVDYIIQMLSEMDVDGETMQYILKQTGMEWQMLRQLMLMMPIEQVNYLMEERKEMVK